MDNPTSKAYVSNHLNELYVAGIAIDHAFLMYCMHKLLALITVCVVRCVTIFLDGKSTQTYIHCIRSLP